MGSTSQQGLSVAQQVQQDYAQLASSLQSGDLAGAQSAFANLQQALQSQGTSTTQSTTESGTSSSSGSDTIANDFSALGQALSSGNLSQAQSAFSQLQTDIQSTQQAEASQRVGQRIPGDHRKLYPTDAHAPAGTAKFHLDDGLHERFNHR